jgi:hypothetical protein
MSNQSRLLKNKKFFAAACHRRCAFVINDENAQSAFVEHCRDFVVNSLKFNEIK